MKQCDGRKGNCVAMKQVILEAEVRQQGGGFQTTLMNGDEMRGGVST